MGETGEMAAVGVGEAAAVAMDIKAVAAAVAVAVARVGMVDITGREAKVVAVRLESGLLVQIPSL